MSFSTSARWPKGSSPLHARAHLARATLAALRGAAASAFVRRLTIRYGGDGPHVTGRIAFAIEVEEDDIDGGYSARCLDLPGCRSDGDTEEEAVNNLIEAIAGVLEARMQRTRSDPTAITHIDLPQAESGRKRGIELLLT